MGPRMGRIVGWMCAGAFCAMAVVPAGAQSNLDAGKSAAQIFADTCNACHRGPRQLRPTNAMFLRDHYTTGAREAAAMAAYLASVGSDPRAVQQRRPPTLGAGQAGATGGTPGTPSATDRGRASEGQAAAPSTAAGRKGPPAAEQSSANAPAGAAPAARPVTDSAEAGKPPAEPALARSADASVLQPGAAAATETHPLEEFEE
jgi:hypothetical protein